MLATLERCVSVLKPGGLVLFRDYGLYDMTMLRFLPHQRVGFREYMRSDGTLSYFFTLDTVRELFHASGLLEVTRIVLTCSQFSSYFPPFFAPACAPHGSIQYFMN